MWYAVDAELPALSNYPPLDPIAPPVFKIWHFEENGRLCGSGKNLKRTPKIETHAKSITRAVKSSYRAFIWYHTRFLTFHLWPTTTVEKSTVIGYRCDACNSSTTEPIELGFLLSYSGRLCNQITVYRFSIGLRDPEIRYIKNTLKKIK